jgi:hypothetical protein
MWELNHAEKLGFIYILCQASKQKKCDPFLSFSHAEKVSNIEKSILQRTI